MKNNAMRKVQDRLDYRFNFCFDLQRFMEDGPEALRQLEESNPKMAAAIENFLVSFVERGEDE